MADTDRNLPAASPEESLAEVAANASSPAGEHLPGWLRRLLIGLGVAGPFIGWFIGFITTPAEANPAELVREVLKAVTGPFGATITLALVLIVLGWHHAKTLAQHAQERRERSASTARIATRKEAQISKKDDALAKCNEDCQKKIEALHRENVEVLRQFLQMHEASSED